MDRGAARSRRRANKLEPSSSKQHVRHSAALAPLLNTPTPPAANAQRRDQPRKRRNFAGDTGEATKQPTAGPSTHPDRYKPKAIRASAALIYSQAPFPLPPSPDALRNVRRVDLAGSGVTDVSWLRGTSVTWLSVVGCAVTDGWDAVGSLAELSVLNISHCGLKQLPSPLKGLKKLKALVAMHNEWETLDEEMLASWSELNSLIISHSLNLIRLPSSLSSLRHLSKLTFSHCARLTASSLPDLSAPPLLRDVKMNNLPYLSALPRHIRTWGTGDMSPVHEIRVDAGEPSETAASRRGLGLDVLDLGNCGLSWDAIASYFVGSHIKPAKSTHKTDNPGKAKDMTPRETAWPNLRSLTLHSNPLAATHPNYADLLQASALLPNLQIIDAKRIKERKRKGEVSESKADRRARERREERMKPSGANAGSVGGKARPWGGGAADEEREGSDTGEVSRIQAEMSPVSAEAAPPPDPRRKTIEKKRKRSDPVRSKEPESDIRADAEGREAERKPPRPDKKARRGPEIRGQVSLDSAGGAKSDSQHTLGQTAKHSSRAEAVPGPLATASHPAVEPSVPDPSVAAPSRRPTRNETSVVTVIEVGRGEDGDPRKNRKEQGRAGDKRHKGKTTAVAKQFGGVDLREVFGKGSAEAVGSSLGVGGW